MKLNRVAWNEYKYFDIYSVGSFGSLFLYNIQTSNKYYAFIIESCTNAGNTNAAWCILDV